MSLVEVSHLVRTSSTSPYLSPPLKSTRTPLKPHLIQKIIGYISVSEEIRTIPLVCKKWRDLVKDRIGFYRFIFSIKNGLKGPSYESSRKKLDEFLEKRCFNLEDLQDLLAECCPHDLQNIPLPAGIIPKNCENVIQVACKRFIGIMEMAEKSTFTKKQAALFYKQTGIVVDHEDIFISPSLSSLQRAHKMWNSFLGEITAKTSVRDRKLKRQGFRAPLLVSTKLIKKDGTITLSCPNGFSFKVRLAGSSQRAPKPLSEDDFDQVLKFPDSIYRKQFNTPLSEDLLSYAFTFLTPAEEASALLTCSEWKRAAVKERKEFRSFALPLIQVLPERYNKQKNEIRKICQISSNVSDLVPLLSSCCPKDLKNLPPNYAQVADFAIKFFKGIAHYACGPWKLTLEQIDSFKNKTGKQISPVTRFYSVNLASRRNDPRQWHASQSTLMVRERVDSKELVKSSLIPPTFIQTDALQLNRKATIVGEDETVFRLMFVSNKECMPKTARKLPTHLFQHILEHPKTVYIHA